MFTAGRLRGRLRSLKVTGTAGYQAGWQAVATGNKRSSAFGLTALTLVAILWPGRVTAKGPQTTVTPERAAQAARVGHAPRLDGTLDDPLWQTAEPISDFLQKEPSAGQAATEQTEVRILYTQHEVYFGVRCSDKQPSQIVASELRRDVSQDLDDHFEILIDSRHDRRNAYVFEFNPLGTQLDGLITEDPTTTLRSDMFPISMPKIGCLTWSSHRGPSYGVCVSCNSRGCSGIRPTPTTYCSWSGRMGAREFISTMAATSALTR
jgi:Carbohydrate family 9 binding domain-like